MCLENYLIYSRRKDTKIKNDYIILNYFILQQKERERLAGRKGRTTEQSNLEIRRAVYKLKEQLASLQSIHSGRFFLHFTIS